MLAPRSIADAGKGHRYTWGRLDLTTYLMLVTTVSVVTVNLLLDYLGFRVVRIVDYSITFHFRRDCPFFTLSLSLSRSCR